MKYSYEHLSLQSFLQRLYNNGLARSSVYTEDEVTTKCSRIGVFKLKGYIASIRGNFSQYSIDDILNLYEFDRALSLKVFSLASDIEIRLKAIVIDKYYDTTDNPFAYLIDENYPAFFSFSKDAFFDWDITKHKKRNKQEVYLHFHEHYMSNYDFPSNYEIYLRSSNLIVDTNNNDTNYPPFHYFIENSTLGTLINFLSNFQSHTSKSFLSTVGKEFKIFQPAVFLSYLLRIKELRNRCAHNTRIFNRNYRSVKAIGPLYKRLRKDYYDHRLVDVYFTILLLQDDYEGLTDNESVYKKLLENIEIDEKISELFEKSVKKKR